MREIALAVGVKNKEIIDFLHAQIQQKMDFCNAIITNYCDNNFVYLLFAFKDADEKQCEDVLRDIIIDYIESIYKTDYLKSKIKNPIANTLAFNAYIKVLAMFDRATDESAINKILLFNETFFVDSFLEFRLLPLKKHWDNLATLSSDNIALFNSGTFVDVIKFLINTMDNQVYKVKVVKSGENFSVYNMKNKNARVKKIGVCNNSLDLITSVISNCPSYIDVYLSDEETNEAVSFLSNIFCNRLKIFTKSF